MIKTHSAFYYFSFVLLIMGGFAAMAQNRYGLYILGIVGILFGLLFAYQCYFVSFKTRPADPFSVLEPACLALLSFLFTLRIFYIHFTLIEGIFSLYLTRTNRENEPPSDL